MSDKTLQFPSPKTIEGDYDPLDYTHEEIVRSMRARRKQALDGLASGELRMTEELRQCLEALDNRLAELTHVR